MKHFIVMSGTHGCLPDYCEIQFDHTTAVHLLAALHNLGSTRFKRLRADNYLKLELSPIERNQGREFGADYCEIQSCDCAQPWIHSDSYTEEQFKREFADQLGATI